MSWTAAARQPKQPVGAPVALWMALLWALPVAAPAVALAEPPTALLFVGKPHGGAARWARRLRDRGLLGTPAVLDVSRWVASLPPSVPPARLRPLARIEELLGEAVAAAASLREDQALAQLAEAAALADQIGDLPGAASWNAEVQLRLGVVAAQAGLPALARVALARAATLDPARQLEPAEAPPDVVALAASARASAAAAPEAALPVDGSAPGARVYVDDVDRGALPAELRLRAGLHALRIEAPGHRSWGALVDVLAGRRPPLRVTLAPDPARTPVRRLVARAREGDVDGVVDALEALDAVGAPLQVLLAHTAESGRAVLLRCTSGGCRGPLRVSPGLPSPDAERALASESSPSRLEAARRWLTRRPTASPPDADVGSHWYVWPLLAGVVAGAATTALLLTRESEEPAGLRIVVDPAAIKE